MTIGQGSTSRDGGVSLPDVALLIDWENLKLGLREQYRVAPNLSSLIGATREHGRLVTARAYADWTRPQLAIDAPNLYRAGIEPIYAQGRMGIDGATIKNSADVRLAVDAVALCSQLPHVRTYVLVTGDGDLIHPVNHIRLHGHRVVIIAVRAAMSSLLESAADVVMIYERDVEPLEAPAPAPAQVRSLNETVELLRRIVPAVLANAQVKQSFPSLNEMLLTRFGFNARSYDKSFKEIMLLAKEHGVIEISTEAGMDYATLPGQKVPTPEAAEEPEPKEPVVAYQAAVRFEDLEENDQEHLIVFIDDLQATSRFLTVKFLVERIAHSSVLPMLSEEQVKRLLLDAVAIGLFLVDEVDAVSSLGQPFKRKQLSLNEAHEAVKRVGFE